MRDGARGVGRRVVGAVGAVAGALVFASGVSSFASGQEAGPRDRPALPPVEGPGASTTDPRALLGSGWMDAGIALENLILVANRPRAEGFYRADDPGFSDLSNTDLAFHGDFAYVGNYSGFMVYDISDPRNPALRVSVFCPGGQGDISVHGNLVFMSAEQTRGRTDCGAQGVTEVVSAERFRGVRIFDLTDMDRPVQVAAVQTCRGSHTHTLLSDPSAPGTVWVYVSGTGVPRTEEELPGCTGPDSQDAPNTSFARIEVIEVPLDRPQDARVVSEPRVFADPATGALAGLWQGGDHGPGTQSSRQTLSCHDITVYPEIGLAAGACSGNGILFDISDPENPVRLHEVTDPNFSFFHSATFNNDGTSLIFTDEWGGGSSPRCRATDPMNWGANALFRIVDGKRMELASYFKLPAAQGEEENCVAHNGSLIPVPGRDLKVQSWYQGGISIFDFTDPSNPFEIAYFDRGPMDASRLVRAGHWSSYWYNGFIYGAEKARGMDVLRLIPSEHLSANEIAAAELVRFEEFNPQLQPRKGWPTHPVIAKAYLDQLARSGGLEASRIEGLRASLERLEAEADLSVRQAGYTALAAEVDPEAEGSADRRRVLLLAGVLRDLAASTTD